MRACSRCARYCALKLAIDFDGTLADTTTAKIEYAREVFGVEVTAAETFGAAGRPRLGDERFREMVVASHGSWTERTPPMPGALEAMRALAAHHELFVVTARTDEEVAHVVPWLRAHAMPVDHVLHTSRGSKLDHCVRMGVQLMFDDLPQMLGDLVGAGIAGVLLDTAYNQEFDRHEALHVVPHWEAFGLHISGLSVTADVAPRT